MKRDSELHATEDEARKESIEAKNLAESTVYEIEKNMGTYKDDINASEKSEIETLIAYVF
jgi:molecular chaperone DnaK (HSP70)